MAAARKFFVGGNFKMNGDKASIKKIAENINSVALDENTETVVAPPSIYLAYVRDLIRPEIAVAAQNVSDKSNGAFTGEISVAQLKDIDVHWAILGHSERRTILGETDETVASKTKKAVSEKVSVILCCGESEQEREAGQTFDVVSRQLKAVADVIAEPDWSRIVIAYEPIWAIGTGKVATVEQAQEVHAQIRSWLRDTVSGPVADKTRILYGGSVNGGNCAELSKQADIDGFLVGGASLKPEFISIVNCRKA